MISPLLPGLARGREDFANGLFHQKYPLLDMQHSNNLAGGPILTRCSRCETEHRIGWKGTQIKLREQCFELGDVKNHVRRHFPRLKDAAADVIRPRDGSSEFLAAFLVQHEHGDGADGPMPVAPRESCLLPPMRKHQLTA